MKYFSSSDIEVLELSALALTSLLALANFSLEVAASFAEVDTCSNACDSSLMAVVEESINDFPFAILKIFPS